jgi:hypothetical protein
VGAIEVDGLTVAGCDLVAELDELKARLAALERGHA